MTEEYNSNMESNESLDLIKSHIKSVIFLISPIYRYGEETDTSKKTYKLEDLFNQENFDTEKRESIWNYISSVFALRSVDDLKTIGSSHELNENQEDFLNFLTTIVTETGTDGFVNIERNEYITQPPFNLDGTQPTKTHKDIARMLAKILGYLLETSEYKANPNTYYEP
jgi:hypothetical protein